MSRRQQDPPRVEAAATTHGRLGVTGWARVATANVARTVIVAVLAFAGWGAGPAAIGWQPTTVMSDSMQPRIAAGDVVVVKPAQSAALRPEQIVLVDDPDHPGRLRLHRLVRFADDGRLVLKGDANPQEDSSPVDPAAVHGVAVLRVPHLGVPIVWLFTRRWVPLAALVGAAGLLALATTLDRRLWQAPVPARPPDDTHFDDRPGDDTEDAEVVPRPLSGPARLRPALVRVLGLASSVALVSAAIAVPASAAVNASTANPGATLAAADYFSCQAAIAASNPNTYYRLNEGSSATTASDASGNGNHGAYQGGRTAGVTGACGSDSTNNAVTLNGATGYVAGPNAAITAPNTFTLALWFKTSTTRGGKLIGFGDARTGGSTNYDRHVYMANDGRLLFGVRPGGTRRVIATTATYNDGNWHHVAATLSPAGMRLYVDGQLAASNSAYTAGQSYNAYLRIGYDLLTGWNSSPTSAFFAGTIDEVTVHLSALTASAVTDQYQAGTP